MINVCNINSLLTVAFLSLRDANFDVSDCADTKWRRNSIVGRHCHFAHLVTRYRVAEIRNFWNITTATGSRSLHDHHHRRSSDGSYQYIEFDIDISYRIDVATFGKYRIENELLISSHQSSPNHPIKYLALRMTVNRTTPSDFSLPHGMNVSGKTHSLKVLKRLKT